MQDSSCSAATGVSRQRRQRTACAFPRDASRSDKTIALDVLGMKRGLNISTKCCANVTPQPRGNLDITYKVTPLLFPPCQGGTTATAEVQSKQKYFIYPHHDGQSLKNKYRFLETILFHDCFKQF